MKSLEVRYCVVGMSNLLQRNNKTFSNPLLNLPAMFSAILYAPKLSIFKTTAHLLVTFVSVTPVITISHLEKHSSAEM